MTIPEIIAAAAALAAAALGGVWWHRGRVQRGVAQAKKNLDEKLQARAAALKQEPPPPPPEPPPPNRDALGRRLDELEDEEKEWPPK